MEQSYPQSFLNEITEQQKIEVLLEKLKNNNNIKEYYENLLLYYQILSPPICQRYNINKTKTEKETFFAIINDLIEKFGDENENEKKHLKNKDLVEYIDNILNKPAKEELKNLKIENIPSRWNIVYSKIIRIETETNEELIYYNQSNDLLNNIRTNKNPVDVIYFLKAFMTYYKDFFCKDSILNYTKKYLLLGLCNCEYVEENRGGFLSDLDYIRGIKDKEIIEDMVKNQFMNPRKYYRGILQETIIKFCKSNLAKSAFIKIFDLKEIPIELQEEIFSDNIKKYVCFFPFSSIDNTERTIRRLSLILINSIKNKKIKYYQNGKLNKLLEEFSNLVVRKFIFGQEHQHLSGGLLYITKNTGRLSTPPHKIADNKLSYDFKSKKKAERGEIFELLAYGKVFRVFSIFDLIFIANEDNDELDIDNHHKLFKEYSARKKDLKDELKKFPKNQIFSDIIWKIYCELLNDEKSCKELENDKALANKKEYSSYDKNDIDALENEENLISPEVCTLSLGRIPYRHKNIDKML